MNIHLLNLTIDRLQLTVDLIVGGQFAKTSKLSSHFHELVLLLIRLILLALLLNLLLNLRFDQVELDVDFQEASILFDEQAQDVARLLR